MRCDHVWGGRPLQRAEPPGSRRAFESRAPCVVKGVRIVLVALIGCTSSQSNGPQEAIRRAPVDVGVPPLSATLTLPATNRPSPVVVLLSGSGPNDQDETVGPNKPFRDLAEGLAARGVATLRYDKRTRQFPASVDAKTFTATDEYVPDALAAINILRTRADIDPDRIFILGHSEGGTMAPRVTAAAGRIAGVILMAAATETLGGAMLRQATYLATLPGAIGDQARTQLPMVQQAVAEIDKPDLSLDDVLTSPLLGGTGPAYFLDLRAYAVLDVARSLPQPILILQGDRDYQVTVTDDFDQWTTALAGRSNVTTHRYPNANHLFIDGSGPPSPLEYPQQPGTVSEQVISDIAEWVLGNAQRSVVGVTVDAVMRVRLSRIKASWWRARPGGFRPWLADPRASRRRPR